MKLLLLLALSLTAFAQDIKIEEPYIRLLPPSAPNTGGFMLIKNESDKDIKLISAESSLSKALEMHTMISEKGMMKMREVKDIKIKAKSSTSLKPGGLHLMFMGLKRPLKKDEKIKVTLKFSDSSSLDVDFPVLNK